MKGSYSYYLRINYLYMNFNVRMRIETVIIDLRDSGCLLEYTGYSCCVTVIATPFQDNIRNFKNRVI